MPKARIPSLLSALLACTVLNCASGEEPVAPHFDQPLTLVQLTDLALSNNPSTRIAWAQIRSSEAGLELARAGYWPQLSVDYSIDRLKQVNFTGAANSAQTRYGPSLSLSYLLWDFGSRSGTVDAARFSLAAARLDANQTMQDLILAVEQDYYQVLGLQALQDADTQSVQDATASLDAAKQRKDSGLATIGDVYQAEAALAGAQLALQTAAGQLEVSRGQLAVAVGYTADSEVPLATLEKQVNAQMPADSVATLLDKAKAARPELLASKAQEQAAVASLEATEGEGWPSLNLDANAGRTTTDIAGQKTSTNSYSAGLTLSFPLFTGFANQASNHRAQAAVDVAQASTDQLMQQVELEVWQAYQSMRTAVSTLDTATVQLKNAQQAADVTNARYKNGLDSILDVLSAQATLANARVQEVQARLNWFGALAAMGHAIGGLDAPKDAMELP
ncbi:MAG TPA: TolC family protein [Gammaproteobacteria bacterium]|nr:TolC family protein [Gammaproteobacteria bacterium]